MNSSLKQQVLQSFIVLLNIGNKYDKTFLSRACAKHLGSGAHSSTAAINICLKCWNRRPLFELPKGCVSKNHSTRKYGVIQYTPYTFTHIQYIQQSNAQMVATLLSLDASFLFQKRRKLSLLNKLSVVHFAVSTN